MVYARRRRGGARKRMGRRRPARRAVARPLRMLNKYSGVKYFTETFDAGFLPVSGGWFTCALSSMINHNQYFGLFDLGYINRFDVMLVPNSGDTVLGTSPATGRITVATSQNFDAHIISGEPEILSEDNAKIIPLDGKRTIKLSCYRPKPNLLLGPPVVEPSKQFQWLNVNTSTAQNTLFGGIKYWISGAVSAEQYQVYIRVYAMFKEQQ